MSTSRISDNQSSILLAVSAVKFFVSVISRDSVAVIVGAFQVQRNHFSSWVQLRLVIIAIIPPVKFKLNL